MSLYTGWLHAVTMATSAVVMTRAVMMLMMMTTMMTIMTIMTTVMIIMILNPKP